MPIRQHRISAIFIAAMLVSALPLSASAARPETPGKPLPAGAAVIEWSGYAWTVKHHNRKIGPGPNFFSSSNVSVVDGRLHMTITKVGNRWYAAELVNTESLGYGTYRWTLASPVPELDPNVVLGLFTWNDDPAYNHREIDVEHARWGNVEDPNNAQYVVQPWDVNGHEHRFAMTSGGPASHSFTWTEGSVVFQSVDALGDVEAWSFIGDGVPVPGGESARINLWLFGGKAPQDGQPVEIVIESFTWEPPEG